MTTAMDIAPTIESELGDNIHGTDKGFMVHTPNPNKPLDSVFVSVCIDEVSSSPAGISVSALVTPYFLSSSRYSTWGSMAADETS